MKVALVASSFLPRRGGVEEHVANVAVGLVAHGHQVVIWSVDQGDVVESHHRGIPIRYLPAPLPSSSISGLAHFARSSMGARRAWRNAFEDDRPDVINIQCFGPNGVYAGNLAHRFSVPLVYSAHGETFMDSDRIFDRSLVLRTQLSKTLRRASTVTACSVFAARDLSRFGGRPSTVRVVPNGIDLNEHVGSLPSDLASQDYILGLGRLVSVKGFSRLIDAYAELSRDARLDVDLVIAGDGPERAALEAHADLRGVSDRVHFTGGLDRPRVGAVMAGARVLVVPSEVEAFGITILEGWRAGVPVISGDRGGPSEFIADGVNGILVDPSSVSAISRAINEILENPSRAAAIADAGWRTVVGFTWERTARIYEQIYAELTALDEATRARATGDHR